MTQWITDNYLFLELFGFITGLVFIVLEYFEKPVMWPVGILTSGSYIFIFWFTGFYADIPLQGYYVVIGFYGWYWWVKGGVKKEEDKLPVRMAGWKKNLIFLGVTVFLMTAIYLILKNYTDSIVPLGDATTTAMGITATWMLTRKYLEQWIYWIMANFLAAGLYLYKHFFTGEQMLLTAILYSVYGSIAIAGYYRWRRVYREQNGNR